MKIRVLHIVHDFLNGGIEGFLYYLTKEQKSQQELDVTILCLQDEHLVTNPRIKSLGVKIIYLKMNSFDRSINKYKRFVDILNAYDIIHWQIFKPILSFVSNYVKPKQIFTVHTAGEKLRNQSVYWRFQNKLIKLFLNHTVDGIANNSKFSRDFWVSKGVSNRNNIVIYNGVFFNQQYNKENAYADFPVLKDKFVIGTTSRLIPWKRVDVLVRAFSQMKNLNKDILLLVVGEGAEKAKLIEEAKKCNVADQVVFTGYKSNVTDFQDAIDLCVFPSVSEPFGLVAVECLYLGKPVVVMQDGGGLVEIVEKVNTDLVASSESSLSNIMDKIYENRDQIAEGIEERRKVAEEFSVANAEERYREFYKQILNQP